MFDKIKTTKLDEYTRMLECDGKMICLTFTSKFIMIASQQLKSIRLPLGEYIDLKPDEDKMVYLKLTDSQDGKAERET